MSYLVLARKWRPTTFDEVRGQDHVIRTLSNAINMNRVAHSFLFTGARGVGKTSTARILAKSLNCEKGATVEPCGSCSSCVEITAGTALDVLEIDGASNRGIGEIRELRESVKYAPSRGRYKIYIIDEVHMLTQEAFNALLKTLEEPPSHVVFIFATTEPQKIPVTILSRCQRFDFKRVPAMQLVEHLTHILAAEGVEMERDALLLVIRESEGSVRDALSLLDRIIAFGGNKVTASEVSEILGVADRKWLHELSLAMFAHDPAAGLHVVHEISSYGYDASHFAREFVAFLRDLLVIRLSGSGAHELTDLSDSEFERMQGIVSGETPDSLQRYFRASLRGLEEISRARFSKLAIEMMVVRLCTMGPMLPVDEWVARLGEIERRLGVNGTTPPAGGSGDRSASTDEAPEAIDQTADAVTHGESVEMSPSALASEKGEQADPEPTPLEVEAVISEAPSVATEATQSPVMSVSQPTEAQPEMADTQVKAEASTHEPKAELIPLFGHQPRRVTSPDVPRQSSEGIEADLLTEEVASSESLEDEGGTTVEEPRELTPLIQANIQPFFTWLQNQDAPLAGELAQAKLDVGDGHISIAFRSDLFAGRFQKGEQQYQSLLHLVQLFFGPDVGLVVGKAIADVETQFEQTEREDEEKRQQRRDAAKSHPAVQKMAEAFGGEVRGVRLAEEGNHE